MSPGRRFAAARDRVANARVVSRELDWLDAVIASRFADHGEGRSTPTPPPPDFADAPGAYAGLVRSLGLDTAALAMPAISTWNALIWFAAMSVLRPSGSTPS